MCLIHATLERISQGMLLIASAGLLMRRTNRPRETFWKSIDAMSVYSMQKGNGQGIPPPRFLTMMSHASSSRTHSQMKASSYKAVVESSWDLRRPAPVSSPCGDADARRSRARASPCAFSSQDPSALSTRAEEKTIFADLDGRSKGPDATQQRRLRGRKTAAHRRSVLRSTGLRLDPIS